ncbi:DNA translocase FtsK 4TM domain-containing protein [Deltaproteobacteria bacterium TL4]
MELEHDFDMKRLLIQGFGVFFAWTLLNVDLNDPTVFHQVYPTAGIQNMGGLFGALISGTLVELLGPAALALPWFLVRLSNPKIKNISSFASWYHAWVIILTLSVLQSLIEKYNFPSEASFLTTPFLLHSGYIGSSGVLWIERTIGPYLGALGLMVTLLFSGIKLYHALPFQPFFSLVTQITTVLVGSVSHLFKYNYSKQFIHTLVNRFHKLRNPWFHEEISSSPPEDIEDSFSEDEMEYTKED